MTKLEVVVAQGYLKLSKWSQILSIDIVCRCFVNCQGRALLVRNILFHNFGFSCPTFNT